MENKFKKGLILGGVLAAGALVGFAMTDEGKELTEELQKDLKTLAKHLKANLHNLEDVTKESFDDMVKKIVDKYAEKKEMAVDAKEALIKALESKWKEMEKEYLAEKEE